MGKDFYEEYLETHTLEEILRTAPPLPKEESKESTPVSLPPQKPLLSPHLYGLLYVDTRELDNNRSLGVDDRKRYILRYVNLEWQVIYEAARSPFPIESILASDGGLYYGVNRNSGGIVNVLSQTVDPLDNEGGSALGEWEGRLLVGRNSDLFDATNHQQMIYFGLDNHISSIQTGLAPNPFLTINVPSAFFYPIVMTYHGELREVIPADGSYRVGKPLLSYGVSHLQAPSKVLLVPWGTFKGKTQQEYPFSVIDCIKRKYLRLNGERITGTTLEQKNTNVTQLKLIHCSKDEGTAEILYGAEPPDETCYAKIDLLRRNILMEESIPLVRHSPIYVLEPVTSLSLHQTLMERIGQEMIKQNA